LPWYSGNETETPSMLMRALLVAGVMRG